MKICIWYYCVIRAQPCAQTDHDNMITCFVEETVLLSVQQLMTIHCQMMQCIIKQGKRWTKPIVSIVDFIHDHSSTGMICIGVTTTTTHRRYFIYHKQCNKAISQHLTKGCGIFTTCIQRQGQETSQSEGWHVVLNTTVCLIWLKIKLVQGGGHLHGQWAPSLKPQRRNTTEIHSYVSGLCGWANF